MNKFELYQQRLENKENIKTIKNNSKEINNYAFNLFLTTIIMAVSNIAILILIAQIYTIINKMVENS